MVHHGVYSESSEMIIHLVSFSKQIFNILVYFVLYQSFRRLSFANSQHYPPAPFAEFIGSLMRL